MCIWKMTKKAQPQRKKKECITRPDGTKLGHDSSYPVLNPDLADKQAGRLRTLQRNQREFAATLRRRSIRGRDQLDTEKGLASLFTNEVALIDRGFELIKKRIEPAHMARIHPVR